MADRTVTAYNADAQDFTGKLAAAASGPGKTPYVDGRELAAILKQCTQMVSAVFTPGTTVDDAGNVIADADDVQVKCGFVPKLAVLVMENGAATELYLKTFGMQLAAIKDYAFKLVNAVAPAWTNNAMRFANKAETDITYVTVLNGITTNTKIHSLLVLG